MSSRAKVVLCAVLLSQSVLAQATATEPPPTTVPPGQPPSAPGVGRASVVSWDGSLNLTVSFEAPAFHGIEPRLGLSYDSSRGYGFVGIGWALSGLSGVQRVGPNLGSPTFTASDSFLLDGNRLLPCAGLTSAGCTAGGHFATEQEQYLRVTRDEAANTWTVASPNGVQRKYEVTQSSAGGATQWGLTRVIDTHGNTVQYRWVTDGGESYLDRIEYNRTVLTLYREARPDELSYATGASSVRMRSRLKTVDVVINGKRARVYRLFYDSAEAMRTFPGYSADWWPATPAANDAYRSRLAAVRRFGSDAVVDATGAVLSGTVDLGETLYGYQERPEDELGVSQGQLYRSVSCGGYATTQYFAGDFDGDGVPDFGCYDAVGTVGGGNWARIVIRKANEDRRSAGQVFPALWPVSYSGAPAKGWCADGRVIAADFNGDKKTDLLCAGGVATNNLALSTGTSFTMVAKTACASTELVVGVADFNGDKRPELLCGSLGLGGTSSIERIIYANGRVFNTRLAGLGYEAVVGDFNGDKLADLALLDRSTGTVKVARDSGTAAAPALSATVWAAGLCHSGETIVPGDFNGDGRDDLLCFKDSNSNAVAFSNGASAFVREPGNFTQGLNAGDVGAYNSAAARQPSAWYGPPSITTSYQVAVSAVADVDGDGRADAIFSMGPAKSRRLWVALSEGARARPARLWNGLTGVEDVFGFQFGDFNADGRTDALSVGLGGSVFTHVTVSLASQVPMDLIQTISTSGRVQTVRYTSTSLLGMVSMPRRDLISFVQELDGVSTKYDYATPAWDAQNRRFLGFGQVTSTASVGSSRPVVTVTTTTSRLDPGFAYRPTHVETVVNGTLRSTEDFTWEPSAQAPFVSRVTRTRSRASFNGVYRETTTDSGFDAYGNQTQSIFYGDTTTGLSSATVDPTALFITRDYTPNLNDYLVDRPGRERVFQGATSAGALLKQTTHFYDGASASNVAPTRGDETRVARWVSTSSGVDTVETTTATYDAFGNVATTEGPDHGYTKVEYDALYNLYPVNLTQGNSAVPTASTLTSSQAFDPACGLTSQTDAAGVVHSVGYDALCRESSRTGPEGTRTTSYCPQANAYSSYLECTTPRPVMAIGSEGGISFVKVVEWPGGHQFEWVDGFGRTVRTSVTARADATIDTTTDFDAASLSSTAKAPTYCPLTAQFDSDCDVPAHEVVTRTDPRVLTQTTTLSDVGTRTRSVVGAAQFRATNEFATDTTSTTDAAGRVVKEEKGGGLTRYERDGLGRVTKLVDPNGSEFTWAYDGLDRVIQSTDPDFGQTQTVTSYPATGGLQTTTTMVRPDGTRTCVTLQDVFGRLSSRRCDGITYSYLYVGPRLTNVMGPNWVETFGYDAAGRVNARRRVYRSAARVVEASFTTQWGYDASGRVKWVKYPDGDALGSDATPIEYDGAGRLVRIPGVVDAATWGADGSLASVTYAGGVAVAHFGYEPSGTMSSVSALNAAGVSLFDTTYTRVKDRITAVSSSDPQLNRTFEYDGLEHLFRQTTTATAVQRTWTSDRADQLVADSSLGLISRTSTTARHAPTAIGSANRTYDSFGRLKTSPTHQVTWDAFDRAIVLQRGPQALTSTYDDAGERIRTVNASGAITFYPQPDLVSSNGVLTKTLRIGGRIVALRVGGSNRFVVTDAQNSVRLVLDGAGHVSLKASYDAYGAATYTSANGTRTVNSYGLGYLGERDDADIGLLYLHARYFDPQAEHFLSPDPSPPASPGVGTARYSYAGGDPINREDPTGLDFESGYWQPMPRWSDEKLNVDLWVPHTFYRFSADDSVRSALQWSPQSGAGGQAGVTWRHETFAGGATVDTRTEGGTVTGLVAHANGAGAVCVGRCTWAASNPQIQAFKAEAARTAWNLVMAVSVGPLKTASGLEGLVEHVAQTAAKQEAPITIEALREVIRASSGRTTNQVVELPKVRRYAELMRQGVEFPPVRMYDGVIVDGNHRWFASQLTGRAVHVEPSPAVPHDWTYLRQGLRVDRRDWDLLEARGIDPYAFWERMGLRW